MFKETIKKLLSFALVLLMVGASIVAFVPDVEAEAETLSPSIIKGSDFTECQELADVLDVIFAGNIDIYEYDTNKEVSMPLGHKMSTSTKYYANNYRSYPGWQCYIYANAVYNKLFKEVVVHGTSSPHSTMVISGGSSTVSFDMFKKAGVKCGAYMRTTGKSSGAYDGNNGHSMIILAYDENYITYLGGNQDKTHVVDVRRETWSAFNDFRLKGYGRYVSHIVQPTDEYYDKLYPSHKCTSFKGLGVCEECGKTYDWQSTFNPVDAGTYKITADFTPRTNAPYEAASKADKQLKKDATVTVLGSYTNAHGSKWYKFTYDSGKVGYVYESYLKLSARNQLSVVCTGFKPENNASLPYGQGYPMYGTITSSNPLKTVEAYLDGSKYATWTASNQSTTKFDINPTDINQKLEFGKLSAGKHTISLKATDIFGQTSTFYTSAFTMASNSNFKKQNILQMEAASSSYYISGAWCEFYYGALCTCQSTSSSKGCADRASDSIWNHRTIHRSGCGIVALVSAIYNTGNGSIAKDKIADAVKEFMNWGGDKGYWLRGMKSNDFFTQSDDKFGSKYGFKISGGQGQSLTNLINHLKNEQGTAVVHVYGHYMVAVDYKYENGVEYLLIFDPFPGAGAGVATGNYSTNRRNVTNASGDWFSIADLTDDGGSKGSLGSKENIEINNYWLVTPTLGSSSGGSTQPTITPATITEDTYYFVNGEHRMYMISDTSGRSNIGASIAAFNSKYEFKVVKDGDHYDIVPVDGKNGYLLNAYWLTSSTKTCNNDEVTLYKSSQGWIFEKCGDGYLIHPRDNTSLSITREDDKLLVKTTTKADNQIWKLVSSACDHTFEYKHEEFDNLFESEGNHWLECTKCGYKTSYETHQWEFVMNTTGQFVMGNSKYHAYRCSVCGLGKYEYHEYSNECDPLCDICNSKVSEREVSHKYDNDCDSTCNVCGTTRSVTHTYSNPCDATCNNCGYVREATHSYEWVRNNETHCQECSICGAQTEPVEHEYRMIGMATDPALKDYHYYGCDICKWGVKELHVYDNDCDRDCNVCAYSGREVEHAASNEYGHDGEIHAKKCPICGGYYAQEEHKFSNDCDTTCNVCNYERSITHNYGALLLSDADGHWNACSVCGEKGNFESHNPGPEATEDSAQVCLDCGYVLEGKKNHEHIYGVYVHNEYQHWRECEADDCNARSDSAGHDFGNNCDVDCSACGFVREVQHEFTNDCDASCNVCGETRETEHTYDHGCDTACNVCGEKRDTEHRYDNAEDEKCNECGFVRDVDNGGNNGGENNPGGETGEKPGNEPGAEDNTVDEPPVDEPEDNTTTVLIIAAAAIVTILGLALILRKRS